MRVYDSCRLKYKKGDVVRIDYQERYSRRLPVPKAIRQDKVAIVINVVEKQHYNNACDGEISYYIYEVLVGLDRLEISEEDLAIA